jgi:hypothetical protein
MRTLVFEARYVTIYKVAKSLRLSFRLETKIKKITRRVARNLSDF